MVDGYSYSCLRSDGPGPALRRLAPQEYGAGKGAGLNGSHRRDGLFVLAGPGVTPAGALPSADIVDVLPTLLPLAGLPIPLGLDGAPIPGVLDRPPQWGAGSATGVHGHSDAVRRGGEPRDRGAPPEPRVPRVGAADADRARHRRPVSLAARLPGAGVAPRLRPGPARPRRAGGELRSRSRRASRPASPPSRRATRCCWRGCGASSNGSGWMCCTRTTTRPPSPRWWWDGSRGRPVVYHGHSAHADELPLYASRPAMRRWLGRFGGLLDRQVPRRADCCIAVSAELGDRLRTAGARRRRSGLSRTGQSARTSSTATGPGRVRTESCATRATWMRIRTSTTSCVRSRPSAPRRRTRVSYS